MSLGQFLEMRYNRPFRITAAFLRSISEMLANMIMPAVGARFFIYFLGLPSTLPLFGFKIPTFILLTLLILTIAVSIICMGGTLAVVITDTIQGMFCYPLLVLFVVFILCKFNWNTEIVPVMQDRVIGQNCLNPYDVSEMRDFNPFQVGVGILTLIINRAVWIGAGNSSAAKTAHEQKMANLLGQWRGALSQMFYVVIAITVIVMLNYKAFSVESKKVRDQLTEQITTDLVKDETTRNEIIAEAAKIPPQQHRIGIDPPQSQDNNQDSTYLNVVHQKLLDGQKNKAEQRKLEAGETRADALLAAEAQGNALFQQFRTLFHQMMMTVTMRNMLPPGMLGLFCLLLIMAMVSTDDSRMYSAALTISQDVILPLLKKGLTPKQHMNMIRGVTIGVGVFFFIGSFFMSQLDYINMYIALMIIMWTGGAGAIMTFGLYSRFGTTAGAFAAMISSVILGGFGIFLNRGWADKIYPFLKAHNWVEPVGVFLDRVSKPFQPYVRWEMSAVKCPINTYEMMFIIICITITLYVVVSLSETLKISFKPFGIRWREDKLFNLERMLHRGKYALDGEVKTQMKWTFRNVFSKLIGITPEYSSSDKVIAWGIFSYSIIYQFGLAFLMVLIWNLVSPWPSSWWTVYFLIIVLVVPAIMASITAVWFGIGGVRDLFRLFRDLKTRIVNPLDDGRVEGNMSLADKAELEAVDRKK
jgi:Na+/proline symporter